VDTTMISFARQRLTLPVPPFARAARQSKLDGRGTASYYRYRPWRVLWRALVVIWGFAEFCFALRLDEWQGRAETNLGLRACQLRELLTRLGPTFIKVGQALSTRPDLVRKDYLAELEKLQDQLPPFPTTTALAIIEEELGRCVAEMFSEISPEQIDYLNEGRNAERFAANFVNNPEVKVPAIYWRYTTHRVLTLEWIDGFKLTGTQTIKSADLDLDHFVRIGVTSGLRQLLEHGFFHADPHPGNLFALRDGRMAYIDFGMMDQLEKETKETLVDSVVHLINEDYLELAQDFVKLGFLVPGTDLQPIIVELRQRLMEVLFKAGEFRWDRLENLIAIARTEGEFDFLPTAQLGLQYLLSEEARFLRQQLVLSLTAGDRLHTEEVRRLWKLVEDDLQPNRLFNTALGALVDFSRQRAAALLPDPVLVNNYKGLASQSPVAKQ